ncbi:MAG: hypothetical protein UFG06_03505 [Lachnospiraceae bacterium]|nr:hypothetical protein [Lachnospiraceae bacterium]
MFCENCGSHGIAVFDGALAALLALGLSGTFTNFSVELLLMFVYGVLVAVFSNLLRIICKREELLGLFTPMLLLLCLAICPILFNFKKFKLLQHLLPPYYYLNALHDGTVLIKMFVFIAVCTAAGFLFFKREAAD